MATTRKKLDNRIKTLIENGIATNHRSIFAIVGDKGRDQIPILYHIMAKCCIKPNPNVLWAYKKELGFSSNRKKRLRRATKMFKSRVKDVNDSNPFEVFTVSTKIRYCYYKEVQNIMGQTYGMCILQDFEALTPNILAQTIETVEGGGLVVFLLSSIKSLKQLCVMKMDVHARYREGSTNDDVVGRFNERFILALSDCNNYLVLNDSLEVMPISKTPPTIEPLPPRAKGLKNSEEDIALKELTSALMDSTETTLAGTLVSCCATLDQGRAVLKMIDALADLTINSTVVMTAGRGRGKSAALGLVMAAAVAYGYRNIYVTSPSPENLKTLFEYIKIGLIALKYEKNREYKVILSSEKELRNVVVRIEISRDGYHQSIEYVNPKDHQMVTRADLVCIDEAAAIPMPHIKKLFGSHHVFMSSTVDGYEGTGSTLSTRFIDVLKQRCTRTEKGVDMEKLLQRLRTKTERISHKQRVETLYEIELQCPIRYSDKDPVEQWLKTLLCLNVREPLTATEIHPPEHCKLYYVNRDTLFSFQKDTEKVLQNLVSMFVASHYKYSPNDIQMLSDAPNHHVFCLLGPNAKSSNNPTILCAVQIALEGEISREAVNNALKRGLRENIDTISWTVDTQFPHLGFNKRSGARVVTIATHPKLQGKGYGSKTLELLIEQLEGQLNLEEEQEVEDANVVVNVDPSQIIDSKLKVNVKLPPLLVSANKAKIGKLDYIGVSFDASYQLVRFFKSRGMAPVYVDIDRNLLTEEHSCIMLRLLKQKKINRCSRDDGDDDDEWLQTMFSVFRRSFVLNLNMECRSMQSSTALALLRNKDMKCTISSDESRDAIALHMTEHNLKMLDEFLANRIDYTQIPDVIAKLTKLVFDRKLEVTLDSFQSTLLLAKGLQKKTQDDLIMELHAIGVTMGHAKMYDDALDLAIRAIIKSLKKCKSEKQNQTDKVQDKTSLKRKADEEKADDKKTKKKKQNAE